MAPRRQRTNLPIGGSHWKCSPRITPRCETVWMACLKSDGMPSASRSWRTHDCTRNPRSSGKCFAVVTCTPGICSGSTNIATSERAMLLVRPARSQTTRAPRASRSPANLPARPPARHSGAHMILVTGGAGYIGCVAVRQLLDKGEAVRVFDKLYFGEDGLGEVRDKIELVQGDIRTFDPAVLDGCDGGIHPAGLSDDPAAECNPQDKEEINTAGTAGVARACKAKGITRFIN